MSNLMIKKIFFLLVFFILFSFYFFEINSFFTIKFIEKNNLLLLNYINQNFFSSIIYFYLIFLIFLLFFIPITSILVIFSSYLFGTLITIPLSIVIVTLGGLLNIIILKELTFLKIIKKAKDFSKKIKEKIRSNEIQYLILLRFIPMPFILQNAIIVLLETSKIKFVLSTIVGISPYIIIYSLAGSKLKELIDLKNNIKMEDILNYENFSIIGLFICLILFSIFLKKRLINN